MNLEIVKNKDNQTYNLIVDGEEVFDSKLDFDPYTSQFICEINDEEFAEKLTHCGPEELLFFRKIKLKPLLTFESKVKLDLDISLKRKYSKEELKQISFFIYLSPDTRYWNNTFSYQEYEELLIPELESLRKIENVRILETKDLPHQYKQFFAGNSEVEFMIQADLESTTIANSIRELISNLKVVDKKIYSHLKENNSFTKINAIFLFPPELKNSCEQYLLYFAQFLQDLGINATSNLNEEAGKVLFSVTPTDDKEALDKIRDALAVYLNLPASPIVYDDSFAAMRLQQQIENLQHSQRMAVRELQFNEKLLIAQSDTIHEKNITISQQQSVIEQQNKIIEKISSKSIMMDSVENKEELEKLYDGLEVSHSKWLFELTGVKANFIKLISTAVKNTFGKEDENKSVLGLDKEE